MYKKCDKIILNNGRNKMIRNAQLKTKKTEEISFNKALKQMDKAGAPVENSTEKPVVSDNKEQLAEAPKTSKSWLVMLILGILMLAGGVVMFVLPFVLPKEVLPDLTFPTIPSKKSDESAVYSDLTGLKLASEADKTAPAFCVQTPNGLDGARPQAGLFQAGVVFEAIAESGITRFAAIYQNPTSAVIGPIRSLRLYYLQWDTPFDCAIVHAGGADDAIAAVRAGGYKDLSENYTYMYRGGYANYDRLWNNLFTTGAYLMQFNSDYDYGGSDIHGFTRMTPEASRKARVNKGVAEKLVITEAATDDVNTIKPSVTDISLEFSGWASYNVNYSYNSSTNSYDRSYASGDEHMVYDCPSEKLGEVIPEDVCTLKQMSPSVVVAMIVDESLAWDGYHEDITTIGTGSAYIFQNGYVVPGTWTKESVDAQIVFRDADGDEIALAPGQTFVEAIPTYGGVEY